MLVRYEYHHYLINSITFIKEVSFGNDKEAIVSKIDLELMSEVGRFLSLRQCLYKQQLNDRVGPVLGHSYFAGCVRNILQQNQKWLTDTNYVTR